VGRAEGVGQSTTPNATHAPILTAVHRLYDIFLSTILSDLAPRVGFMS